MSTSPPISQEEFETLRPFSNKLSVDKNLKFKIKDDERDYKLQKLSCQTLTEKFKEIIYQELADKLKESTHKEQPIDKLISTKPYPNPGILGQLALKAYADYSNSISRKKHEAGLELPGGWKLLATATNSDEWLKNGYFGAAYWSPANYQIVIAHRGTRPSNIGALYTDFEGIVRTNYVSQMNSAGTFANVVISALNEINKGQKINFQLFFTGHSLGGWLAQITTFTAKYLKVDGSELILNEKYLVEGYHAHTVVFDSPGCDAMLSQMQKIFDVRGSGRSIFINHLDITSYLSAPNRVNTCNAHVGKIYRTFTDLSDMSWRDKHTITYSMATHSMEEIMDAFDSKTGQVLRNSSGKAKIQEVVDWPISDGLRRGQEYKDFFNWAKHLNNYHPETKSVEFQAELRKRPRYSPIRYQTKPFNEQECSISVFTQSEQKFLGIYQELRKVPDFFKPNSLFAVIGSVDNRNSVKAKLATFDIKNEIIHCKSAKQLQELIPYVKNLLRFFPGVSEEVEEALTEPVKKAVIKSRSLNGGLEKYFRDFTVDAVLKKTLQASAKRPLLLSVTEDISIAAARIYKAFKEITTDCKEHIILSLEGLLHIDQMIDLVELLGSNDSYSSILIKCKQNFNLQNSKTVIEDFSERVFKILENNSEIKVILVNHKDNKELNDVISTKIQELKLEYESTEVNPLTWNSLTPKFQGEILERQLIVFQGRRVSLNQLIDDNSKQIVNTEILVKLINKYEVKIGDELSLFSGYEGNYYIERTLNYQRRIKKEVFKVLKDESGTEITDIFAVSDIEKATLSRLVPEESTGRLFEENNSINGNSTRFIVLDNEQASEQFQQLCQQNSESNVHWLKYESQNDSFIWQQSQGSLSMLRQHIDNNYTDSYLEHDWVNQERPPKIVIISDTAGMGKSTILTHLSQQIKVKSPNVWLIRIDLNSHTDKLKDQKEKGSFKAQEINTAVAFLARDLLKLETHFEQDLFKHYCQNMQNTGKLIIMFDGFDEISPDYKETVIDLMQSLRKSQIEQLWVTTRPNMREDLEDGFLQFAYMLKPFSEDDQKKFLTMFWAQKLQKLEESSIEINEERLEIYADQLIKLLAKSISDKDREFTGIPLQTRMLAEAFQNECREFQISNQLEPELPANLDLIDLYERFLKKKYDIYQVEKNNLDLNRPRVKAHSDELYLKFIEMHQNLAFYTLFEKEKRNILLSEKFYQEFSEEFPTLAASILQQPGNKELLESLLIDKQEKLNSLMNNIKQGKERTGIVDQIIEGEPHFIHRTFAEYLVAKFFVNSLKYPTIQEFLTREILMQDGYQVIRAFVNGQLGIEALAEDILAKYGELIKELWQPNRKDLYNAAGKTLLHLAAAEGNVKIASFLLDGLTGHQDVRRFLLEATTNYYPEQTALHLAAEGGKWDVVKLLIEKGADVNATDIDGGTVLHRAAHWGKLEVVKWLVEKGGDVNATDNDGGTVLHRAAHWGELEVVKWLVEKGADVNAANKNGETVLHGAAYWGKLEVVKLLVEKGADVNVTDIDGGTVLHRAAHRGRLEVVKWLVEKGADVNAADNDGGTVLHRAAHWGKLEVVKWLVEKGADVNAANKNGETVLHGAAYWGKLEVVKLLVEKGADVNVIDNGGWTVLHGAAHWGKLEVVKWSVEKGVDVNAAGKNGETVLHGAASGGKLEVVRWLIEKGADVNAADKNGETVLQGAAYWGKLEVVKLLVEKGADVNVTDNGGWTVLQGVARRGEWEVVKWWVEKGADVNAADKNGETVLHGAAYWGKLDVVKWLVTQGADVNATNNGGRTPLHWAAIGGKLDVVKWLVTQGADANAKANDGRTLLYSAAEKGNWDVVEWLVEYGKANVGATDGNGNSLLNLAEKQEHKEMMEYLKRKLVEFAGHVSAELATT